jgi:glucokinase
MDCLILAGDVGGTKTHLGLYRANGEALSVVRDRLYRTADFKNLSEACADFLSRLGEPVKAACFGVPGPVIEGEAHATNVPWLMREAELSRELGATPVRLINDLAATAYGVIHLDQSEFAVLQRGRYRVHGANIAVIAAGTGLGEAALVFEDGRFHAVPSEGGHADFAPRSDEQLALYRFLRAEFGHVSVERVLSGPGLFNIYRFLRQSRDAPEPEWLQSRLKNEDPAAVVSEVALEGRDPQCVCALAMFVDIYGAEAGNMALKVLALGGVYIGGGIAPKILPALQDGRFIKSFSDKGRLARMLGGIEVRVSLNPDAALLGAAYCARAML